MKKFSLLAIVLALSSALLSAQTPSLTRQQRAAVLAAIAKNPPSAPVHGQMSSTPLPGSNIPAAGLPMIVPSFVTVGVALAPITSFQPTPCFGCLTTTNSGNTFGVTLPQPVIPTGTTLIQFVETFESNTYSGPVTLSVVVLNGTQVLSVSSVSGFIFPSIWSVFFLQDTPKVTNTELTAVAVITYGNNLQINKARAIPFWVTP